MIRGDAQATVDDNVHSFAGVASAEQDIALAQRDPLNFYFDVTQCQSLGRRID
jgi:hypothetical protein